MAELKSTLTAHSGATVRDSHPLPSKLLATREEAPDALILASAAGACKMVRCLLPFLASS